MCQKWFLFPDFSAIQIPSFSLHFHLHLLLHTQIPLLKILYPQNLLRGLPIHFPQSLLIPECLCPFALLPVPA